MLNAVAKRFRTAQGKKPGNELCQMVRDGREETAMLLLMGGRSTRMGTSKAELLYEGQPFWQRIAGQLASCGPLYLSVARGQRVKESREAPWAFSVRGLIEDQLEGIGPMGGLYTAMCQTEAPSFFVCACDMPLMSGAFVEHLLGIWRGLSEPLPGEEPWDGVMVRSAAGRIYATAGIYSRRLRRELERRIRAGDYRMMDVLRSSHIYYVEEESLGELAQALTNVNTMEEYGRLTLGTVQK